MTTSTIPAWEPHRLRRAVDAAGAALWSWDVDTDGLSLDERAYELWGMSKADATSRSADLSSRIHPADRDQVGRAFAATRDHSGPFEIDFRITVSGRPRWISAKGQGDESGTVSRTRYGLFQDVTARKEAEEASELLAGEMSHRVKNLLGIAVSLANITARSTDSTAAMARELTQRLVALGRAHDLVRPTPGAGQGGGARLGEILSVLLAPYADLGDPGRVRIDAPNLDVGQTAATALALVVHELATNSMKYGALSIETGVLEVSCAAADGSVSMLWRERGGPPVSAPRGPAGFGGALVELGVARHLGGSIAYDWAPRGLEVTLRFAADRLSE